MESTVTIGLDDYNKLRDRASDAEKALSLLNESPNSCTFLKWGRYGQRDYTVMSNSNAVKNLTEKMASISKETKEFQDMYRDQRDKLQTAEKKLAALS